MRYYTEKASRELRKQFELEVQSWSQVSTRPMFGCPSYQAAGRLFAFLVDEGVVITHIRKADREVLRERFTVTDFQAGERVIERWAQVEIDDRRNLAHVIPYVRKSYEEALENTSDLWSEEDGP